MENPSSSSINSLLANFLSKLKFNLNDYVQCRNERVDHDDASLIANTISHSESSALSRNENYQKNLLPSERKQSRYPKVQTMKGDEHLRKGPSLVPFVEKLIPKGLVDYHYLSLNRF